MSNFFENHIIIESENITFEEENEIIDLVKIVLRRKKVKRQIKILNVFTERDIKWTVQFAISKYQWETFGNINIIFIIKKTNQDNSEQHKTIQGNTNLCKSKL